MPAVAQILGNSKISLNLSSSLRYRETEHQPAALEFDSGQTGTTGWNMLE